MRAAVFFTPLALVITEISSGDDGRTDRVPVWFSVSRMAMEACVGVGGGEPRSVKACAAVPSLPFGLPDLYRTRPSTVVLSIPDDSGVCGCLADTCLLET